MDRLTIKAGEKLRPCLIKGETKALFHRWADYAKPYAAILAGDQSGQVWSVYAIVEYEDGKIDYVSPTSIKFLDGTFKEYAFSPNKTQPFSIEGS